MSSPVSERKVKSGARSPSRTTVAAPSRRAVGIVRVSRVGDREGESFASLNDQRARIVAACERDGLTLLDTISETDVSGGASLEERHGLSRAVQMVEAGEADVIVAAYFDRLVRSLDVQRQVVERVEAAGGAVLAVDTGQLTNGSAGQWLSGGMLGLVAEYHRRATAERTEDAKRRAIARGVPTFSNVPPGYRRRMELRSTGKLECVGLEPDPETAPVIAEAFELRASGATIGDVRTFLAEHGIARSYHGVQALLGSRIMLGELHFGQLENVEAHTPIVTRETFERVQRVKLPRGRRPKSDRLLARLGVLRCGTCNGRMVVGSTDQGGKRYPIYRCSPTGDCPRRVTISATAAEAAIVQAVQDLLADVKGSASVEADVAEAERNLAVRQAELDVAIRTLAPVADEEAARDKLAELRAARDEAQDRLAVLAETIAPRLTVSAGDWHLLTGDERRALIRATIAEATVAPGRGHDRLTIVPRSE